MEKVKAPKSSPPKTPEQLRARYKTMNANWQIAKLRHSGKSWLRDLDKDTWVDHVEWLLGGKVLNLKAGCAAENTLITPSWQTFLGYEYEVRKEAVRLCNRTGVGITAALATAGKDYDLRHRFLLTPMTLHA